MALPKLDQPIFSVTVKELGKTFKFRPFVMKEEKALLVAKSIGDDNSVRYTIEQVVKSCIISKDPIDIESLPAHIVDFLYINIFTKSNSSRLPVDYQCRNVISKKVKVTDVDENGEEFEIEQDVVEPCGHVTPNNLNLEKVVIKYPEGYEDRKQLKVDGNTTIFLEYPKSVSVRNINTMNQTDGDGEFVEAEDARVEAYSQLIFESVVQVVKKIEGQEDEVTLPGVDFNKEELMEWIDELPKEVTYSLSEFFAELPTIQLVEKLQCLNPECMKSTEYEITGAKSFFLLS